MKILVTGSAGHLGEALMRTLRARNIDAVGLDVLASPFTDVVGSIADRATVAASMRGVTAVLHAATLHKPHVASHARQAFVDVNVTGTLNLLEEAVAQGVGAFIYTSTTSSFGDALTPPRGAPAAWITEDVVPIPKNIYGVTKVAAEDLCQLFFRNQSLPCLVLRTSRFFPEEDDVLEKRQSFDGDNLKINELLYRRVDLEDVVGAHLCALEKVGRLGFGRYIISATTPFTRDDAAELGHDAPRVLARHVPEYAGIFAARGWTMLPTLDRVYDNERARRLLGWQPRYDFRRAVQAVATGGDWGSPLAREVGAKGYHR
ncbi:MAG TPA: NAD(P)-dependent oxidoreductase [Steroidobacteraceae bacterium]|jgi:UDP-glucose 4-epimerase|nr:NAD(P)-dependent oxidoreductase [Steroidobacteraceae bacterium]